MDEDLIGPYYLWKLLIDEPLQGRGYGAATLDAVVDYLLTRPGADVLYTSCTDGPGSPRGFYLLRYGFTDTGRVMGRERPGTRPLATGCPIATGLTCPRRHRLRFTIDLGGCDLRGTPAARWVQVGLFALPVYGLLTAYATLEPQPDQVSDPEGWARFVSSSSYLVGHVLGNVVGAVLVIFGTFALGAYLTASQAPRLGLWGMVLAVTGHILFTVPGAISTFATAAIGAAHLAGNRDVMSLEFSPVVTAIIALGLLLAVTGNILLSVAIWRSGTLPRWAGLIWAGATLIFYVLGAALGMATTGASLPTQPIGAVLMAIGGAWIAWSAFRDDTDTPTPIPPTARV
jgi:hypothetical protein